MKILIISTPRSGSTNLFNGLYKSIEGFMGFCEPFNSDAKSEGDDISKYSLEYSKVLVKILPWDIAFKVTCPYDFLNHIFLYNQIKIEDISNDILNFLKDYIKYFDKIIILSRKNLKESFESMDYALSNRSYHSSYTYKKTNNFSLATNYIKNHDKIIHRLSQELNLPITYYEDLFLGNIKNINKFVKNNDLPIKNFKILYEYLNPKKKYRQK